MIYTASAIDPDGDNISYYIPTNSLNSDKFGVNETGEVFTQPGFILDREVRLLQLATRRLRVTALLMTAGVGS